jgi:hypothetical protein
MEAVLWLLALQGALGAFDTLYYHELRAQLPAGGRQTRDELRLHAARDFVYAAIFGTLPAWAWHGAWAALLAALIVAEIAITLFDFAIEDRVRAPQGGVRRGERATHALMGIVYGAMLAHLAPELWRWWQQPTAFAPAAVAAPAGLRLLVQAMGLGVFVSGLRDLAAALQLPGSAWPWHARASRL